MSHSVEFPPLAAPDLAESSSVKARFDVSHEQFSDGLQLGGVALGTELLDATPERRQTMNAIERMAVPVSSYYGDEVYYEAAEPGYKRDFTRDSIKTGMMAGFDSMLLNQIEFSARRLGKEPNPLTGEESGKPPHEWPAPGESRIVLNGRQTTYNACDTGASLLQGMAALIEHGHPELREQYEDVIQQIVSYVKRHVTPQGLFIEDPAFSGDTARDGRIRRYALKVTDWKDSELNRTGRHEPHYPITYGVVHFQNANALQRIGYAIGDERLARFGRYMTEQGILHLWCGDHFITAVDDDGEIDPPSTDSLEALLYIPPAQLPAGYAKRIERYSAKLETAAGYRAGIPAVPDMDMYHMKVWVHSQAELHAAAQLHGLTSAMEVASRVHQFIDRTKGYYPELVDPDTYERDGNIRQLWAMGADMYFLDPDKAYLAWTPPTNHTWPASQHSLSH